MKRWRIMDYPRHLHVGDVYYRVVFVRRIPGDDDGELVGCCCGVTKTIWIALGQSASERAETFIHECLHALEYEYRVPLAHRLIYRLEAPLAALVGSLLTK